MSVFSIIFGILLVIGGFSCMFTPLATFLSSGYYITAMLLVYGLFGIIRFVKKQAGGLELCVSIFALLAGILALFRPGEVLVFDRMVLIFIAAWLVVQGIVSIMISVNSRNVKKGWVWGLISGILGVLVGLYSFAHPVLTAVTAGVLIGFYFVQAGFNMIAVGCMAGDAAGKD
jgi:uncharacterized membrane protein HdeD (DUF308 family)